MGVHPIEGKRKALDKMRSIFLVALMSTALTWVYPQAGVQWLTFEEALQAQAEAPRKMMVHVYTQSCSWCQKMDQLTYKNSYVANYLNQHFYAVRLDAEYTGPISFNGKVYTYVRTGRSSYHELAIELTMGRLDLPSLAFLDEELQTIQSIRGFTSPFRLEQILSYFALDHYKTTPWSRYAENYHNVISRP